MPDEASQELEAMRQARLTYFTMRLAEVLPDFVAELTHALNELGCSQLASTVSEVEIVDLCRCNEPGCISFYTCQEPLRPYAEDCERIIAPIRGVSCVHHRSGEIVWVEALGRPEERATLIGHGALWL